MKHAFVALVRVVIGGMFVYLGWTKTQDPVAFLKSIREFGVLTEYWQMNLVAAWLPWFEVWCGVLLVLGAGIRTAAATVGGLLLAFTGMILWRAMQVHAGGGIAFCDIQFDCGCGTGEVLVCNKLAQNCLLTVASLGLALIKEHRFACWPNVCIGKSVDGK